MDDVMGNATPRRRAMRWIGGLVIGVLLAGCSPEAVDPDLEQTPALAGKADTAQTATVATLVFDKQWNETVSGVLTAGGQVAIDYHESRLPSCRASHNGNPGWQITAYLRTLPGGAVSEAELFAHASKSTGESDYYSWVKQVPVLAIPAGTTELQLWFKNVSGFDHPCTEWDSDFGRNYRFPVAAAAGATVSFNKDWSITRKGALKAGGTVGVSYAPERMKSIANGSGYVSFFASKYHCYGYGCCEQEYQNVLHARFKKNGAWTTLPLSPAASLAIPADATMLEAYIDSHVYTTTWYCGGAAGPKYRQPTPDLFYDSNFGKNFFFELD
jgi:hypothetical protein